MTDRYVVLGLAPARAEWHSRASRWAASAILPIEFVRCLSVDELAARLETGRAYSAALVDANVVGLDRDLIALARSRGCPVVVVGDTDGRDWNELGAAARIDPGFERAALIDVLRTTATLVADGAPAPQPAPALPAERHGRLVAVTGPGGTGASMTAIALAQGLATPVGGTSGRPAVLLGDFCRVADQAMLHDARALVPGVPELVDAHRVGRPDSAQVRDLTFAVGARGYRLLLGLRRPEQWTTLAPHALAAALESLCALADWVVADIEPDTEDATDTGSHEVEQRHVLARSVLARADAVVVVGEPSFKGVHALVRTLDRLAERLVPGDRLLPVIIDAPRAPKARTELRTTVRDLSAHRVVGPASRGPVLLPRRPIERRLREGLTIPTPIPRLVAAAVRAVASGSERREPQAPQPVRVGSIPVLDA
jgi:hypothetical protein